MSEYMPINCGTCRFYDNLAGSICRRHPPVIGYALPGPAVNTTDWCGEWKARSQEENQSTVSQEQIALMKEQRD